MHVAVRTGQQAGGSALAAMTFDKFAWFKAIYAETRPTADSKKGFPPGEKAVLAHIAIVNVLTGRDTFCIRQDTIADQCGISRVTVNSAISRAKQLGYLVVSREHDRGYHRNGADELRLLFPELSKEALQALRDEAW
jgi:biotin operon repressor